MTLQIRFWRRAVASLTLVLAAVTVASCSRVDVPAEPIITGTAFVAMTVSDLGASSTLLSESVDLEAVAVSPDSIGEWSQLLGVTPSGHALLRGVNSQFLMLSFDEGDQAGAPVPVQGPGIAHVCFQVNQTTGVYERLLSGGATPIGAADLIQINPKRPVFYGYVHDPDDIIYEIEHVDVAALDLPTPPVNDYRIRQVAISTPDIDAAVNFYSVLFSEGEPRRIGRLLPLAGEHIDGVSGLPGTQIKMAWFQSPNLELELIEYASHPTERPATPRPMTALGFSLIVFDVTDLDEARKRVLDAGGELVSDSTAFAEGMAFLARDLDGNLLGFQQGVTNSALSSEHFDGNGT